MVQTRRGLSPGDPVHGVSITTAEVEQLLEWLASRTIEQRRQVPGLNPERADIILAGLAVTAELLDKVRARSLTVSAFGLREGLLLEMAGAEETLVPDPLRLFREFAERCQSRPPARRAGAPPRAAALRPAGQGARLRRRGAARCSRRRRCCTTSDSW